MYVAAPGIAGLGWPELIIIVLVLLLLFGGRKLPEMARGTGRALRIFKAETKGLMDNDDDDETAERGSTSRRTANPEIGSAPSTASASDPSAPAPRDIAEPLPPTHTEK